MKSLATLIKLQKTRVDEQRQLLGKLQAQLENIQNAVAELEITKARELVAVQRNEASRATYGAFLESIVKRGRMLEKNRVAAAAAVESARDRLIELFEEQKRYEIAEASRLAARVKEEQRQETLELDEIGSITHERQKK